MCEYCESEIGFIPINNTVDYSGLEIGLNAKGMLRCRAYMFKRNFETQDVINIKFCPMCGRKLGDVNEE